MVKGLDRHQRGNPQAHRRRTSPARTQHPDHDRPVARKENRRYLRHRIRRRNQKGHLLRDELRHARPRRLPNALLMQCGPQRPNQCRPLLRTLRHRQNHTLSRPKPRTHRRRRARLGTHRSLQLRRRLLRQSHRAHPRKRTRDLGRHQVRFRPREHRHRREDPHPRLRRCLHHPEHPRHLPGRLHQGRDHPLRLLAPKECHLPDRRRIRSDAPSLQAHPRASDVLLHQRLHQ